MRFVTPAAFFLCAFYVHHVNSRGDGTVLGFPFLETLLPSLRGDPLALARASEGLLVGMGGLMLLLALVRAWMSRRDAAV